MSLCDPSKLINSDTINNERDNTQIYPEIHGIENRPLLNKNGLKDSYKSHVFVIIDQGLHLPLSMLNFESLECCHSPPAGEPGLSGEILLERPQPRTKYEDANRY